MSVVIASRGRREKSSTRRAPIGAAAVVFLAVTGCNRGQWTGVLDPANELPFGVVDVPVQNAQVKSEEPISGWAMDDRGVKEIRVYVDGHIVSHGPLTIEREDVSRAYPRYARASHRHGFTLLMGFDAPGKHTVLVQAVDSDGATRDIGTVQVTSTDQ